MDPAPARQVLPHVRMSNERSTYPSNVAIARLQTPVALPGAIMGVQIGSLGMSDSLRDRYSPFSVARHSPDCVIPLHGERCRQACRWYIRPTPY